MATKVRQSAKKRRAKRYTNPDLAYGFDVVDSYCGPLITSGLEKEYDIDLFSRIGIYCYYLHKGKNLKLVRVKKYSSMYVSEMHYYITFEATDPSCNSVFSYQTLFSHAGCQGIDNYVLNTWRVLACRPRCKERLNLRWDEDEAIDQFYTAPMPKWLSDEALSRDNKKYYVVQDSEQLQDNEWLHLFMELAFFSIDVGNWVGFPSLKMNKVVVETKEDYITEAREKLKAENAIFYISYKCNDVSSSNGDHKAIVRKTMDGKPEHMTLEVAFEESG